MSPRAHTEAAADPVAVADGVEERHVVPARTGSALALSTLRLAPGARVTVGGPVDDVLLFVVAGAGTITVDDRDPEPVGAASAALVLAGEAAELDAGAEGVAVVRMGIGAEVDSHAPMGPRATVVAVESAEAGSATGSRSFQVLFGPHNGSRRATLFVGYIPPGRAPWHYHLYDEIVWVWRGPGRLHLESGVDELSDGTALRLAPREVHIVENRSEDREMAVLGLFTPAGSPSAAYLASASDETYDVGAS